MSAVDLIVLAGSSALDITGAGRLGASLSVKQSLLIDGAFTARCVSAIQDTLSVYGSFQAFSIFSGTVRSV